MAKTIWKAELQAATIVVMMPIGAQVIAVQTQMEQPCMWFECDPDAEKERRVFSYYGTGHPLPDTPGYYVGTFQLQAGALIFHVYEQI